MFLMGPSMVSTVCVRPAAMWFAVRCGGLLNSDTFIAGDPWVSRFCGGFIKTHQHPPSCILAIAHLSYLMVTYMNSKLDQNAPALTRSVPSSFQILSSLIPSQSPKLHHMSPATMSYFLRVAMSRELQLPDKLPEYNTVDDAVRLMRVSCGIPDFRSRDGLYASLKDRGEYDLDDPNKCSISSISEKTQLCVAMFKLLMASVNASKSVPLQGPPNSFDYKIFTIDDEYSQIYPSNFVPSPCHRFIKLVEDKNQACEYANALLKMLTSLFLKLLRNYTQNIDGLHTLAGVTRVLECHGSFVTASCILSHRQVPGSEIEADIMAQKVPLCLVCNAPQSGTSSPKKKGKKKSKKKAKGCWDSDAEDESDGPTATQNQLGIQPDITFFGEKLKDHFDHSLATDRSQVDLLLVVGTSLKVSPVADILCHLPHSVPQILINKTPVRHINPDIVLLGNVDNIIAHLCSKLGWDLPPATSETPPEFLQTKKRSASDLHALEEPRRVGDSHVWLFDGAEGGEWLKTLERQTSVEQGFPALALLRALNRIHGESQMGVASKSYVRYKVEYGNYQAAVEGITLLKNDGTLPLAASIKKLAFIGPWAGATTQMQGNYAGIAPTAGFNVTLTAGTAINSNNTSGFAAAIAAAQAADAIIYAGGIDDSIEAEGMDRDTIVWPGNQLNLIAQLAALGKPLVVLQFVVGRWTTRH
ncbi:DHS-like NAD/FAD-binding domain-containing protein [Mycena galopus ATCC 62051]|nr:DHS-like NAD/FAD-binding domain-containing protein [Mycena galopus ATCC 62051]